VVPPAFAVRQEDFLENCLRITITGEPDSLTAGHALLETYPSENDIGEVDFAACPTISH